MSYRRGQSRWVSIAAWVVAVACVGAVAALILRAGRGPEPAPPAANTPQLGPETIPSNKPGQNPPEGHEKSERPADENRNSGDQKQWKPPRFEARREERRRMVRNQIVGREIKDKDVLEAMRHVPRHSFVPDAYRSRAYADTPLPIGEGQTISQPYIVAYMTDLLELEKGDKVLEIGTGSGYQAAVLTEITPHVFTIEIIEELAATAEERLDALGYTVVKTKTGDGYYGWEKYAPFDGIIVTAAAGHIPPPLVKQLKKGGRMVIPVGGVFETQYLILAHKDEEGKVRTDRLLPVRFVPMTGRAQKPK